MLTLVTIVVKAGLYIEMLASNHNLIDSTVNFDDSN